MSVLSECPPMSAVKSHTIAPFSADFARVYETTTGPTMWRILSCYRTHGLHAIAAYRIGQWCATLPWVVRWPFEGLYQYLAYRATRKWGIDISRAAQIGPGLLILHQGGIIIGAVHMGHSCTISQGVTLGGAGHGEGYGLPTLGNQVFVAAGAKVFGKITIGDHVKIGANAVVHCDIPVGAVVALVPGFTILVKQGITDTVAELCA